MKTEVRVVDDRVELWYNFKIIATIEGPPEGPGARIQSTYPMAADFHTEAGAEIKYVDILIDSEPIESPPEP